MTRFGSLPIRRKLVAITAVTSVVAIVVSATVFLVTDVVAQRRAMVRNLETLGRVIASNCTAALAFNDAAAATETVGALKAIPQIDAAEIYSPGGEPFASFRRDGVPVTAVPAKPGPAGCRFEGGALVLFRPIDLETDAIGTLYLKSNLDEVRARLKRHFNTALGALLASMLVVVLLSARLHRAVSEPLHRLAEATAEIGGGKLDTRVEFAAVDEVGALAEAFNRMVQNLGVTTVSKEYFDTIIRSLADALIVMRLDGTVEMVNRAALTLLGCESNDIVGRKVSRFMRSSTRFDELLATLAETGMGAGEAALLHRDGHEIPVSYTLSIMRGPEGGVIGCACVAQDITERRNTERELERYYAAVEEARLKAEMQAEKLARQAEALEEARNAALEAARLKSEFLANMSHEIRTPMNGVIGMTDLALGTEITPEQREYLETIKVSADSLLTVLNDVLDFSKVEAGRLELEAIPFSVSHNLRDTLKTLAYRAHQKGIELACQVEEAIPDGLVGDPGRLRQILLNLVGNAIKFTERGEVLVRVSLEESAANEVLLHYAVRDTGIGIPADKLQLVFEPFTQADGSTTRKYGGTGLGLSIASHLVELMSGRIWVESELGKGSTFHFTARFARQPESAAHVAGPRPVPLEGLRALVMDDSETNRRIFVELLSRWKIATSEAATGERALQALRDAAASGMPFEFVLLDGQMPDLDGFAVARAIREDPLLRGAHLVMMTSAGHPGDGARCRELGVAGYLTKPILAFDLLETMHTVLRNAGDGASELVTQHTRQEHRRRLKILLAEDNPVNRLVGSKLLEKRGHAVVAVEDGSLALAALEKERFDAVLMDLQMAGMDGFQATAAIRARERRAGGHVPIIALTAHALKGDAERCFEAGMDGYVSKPIRAEELFAELERLTAGVEPPPSEPETVVAPSSRVIDVTEFLARVGSDRTLVGELVDLFRTDSTEMLRTLRDLSRRGDSAAFERTAHRLKGALGTLAAVAAREIAERLEKMGHDGTLEGAGPLLDRLEREVARLEVELVALASADGGQPVGGSAP